MDTEDRLETRMEKKEPSDATTRKRIKQAISVPFIWEDLPGTPKKDWKPTAPVKKLVVVAPPPLPVKFIASVPFEWEEKPGKPRPSFSQQPSSASPISPNINSFPLSPRHSLGGENSWTGMNDQDGDEIEMLESYPESCEFETDDSFSSAPSLFANGLVPRIAISNAFPVQQNSLKGPNSGPLQSPASPVSETGSSTSSYETGHTSLAGASFLEWLFPLLTPQSNFLGCSEKGVSYTQTKMQKDDIECERNYSAAIRKPYTLGELIMMSRGRSYQRKALHMRTQNLSTDFMKRNALGCCIIGSSNFIGRFHRRWTRQLQLKLA